MNVERPQARSLLLCDQLVVEERTRNVSLINCFTQKVFDQFPSPPMTCFAFAALSNGFGQFPIKLEIESLEHVEWRYEYTQNAMFLDRMKEMRFWVRLVEIRFPGPGAYAVTLSIDNEVLADTRIEIRKRGHRDD